jgi:hypothetical protein
MSDPTSPYEAMSRQWLQDQQRAWQAWLGGDTTTHPAGDPAAALAGWCDASTPGGEVAGRLLDQGRQFLQLAEALGETLTAQARDGTPPDWRAVFDDTLARVRATLEPDADGDAHPAGALGGLLGEWQKLASGFGLPQPQAGGGEAMTGYITALHGYAARLADIQRDALDRLQHELNEQHDAGATITSLRALYDLWVDASEAAYAEQAPTEAFAAAQAQLAHALCRLHAAGAGR